MDQGQTTLLSEYARAKGMLKSVAGFYAISLVAIVIFVLTSIDQPAAVPFSFRSLIANCSFVVIGLISIFFLTSGVRKHGISLFVVHWFFVLVFFCLIPLRQFLDQSYRFPVNYHSILIGNTGIIAWCVLYAFFWRYKTRVGAIRQKNVSFFQVAPNMLSNLKGKMIFMAVFVVCLAIVFIKIGGIHPFLLRGSYFHFIEQLGGWNPFGLLVTYYLRPIMFMSAIVLGWLLSKKVVPEGPVPKLAFTVILLANLLINNPLNCPRFYAFMMLFGILILYMLHRNRSPRSPLYITVLFVGLFVASMVDALTRYMVAVQFRRLQAPFNPGDFDAHENFMHTIAYVGEAGISFGKQMLGVLFFWVPRSLWMDKPVGSGVLMASKYLSKLGATYTNISSPLIAEMYINFHVLGIVFGAILFGLLTGWLDNKWFSFTITQAVTEQSRTRQPLQFFCVLYPFLLGFYLFQLRGDLMSSFAYLCGFVSAFTSVIWFLKLPISIKGRPKS